MRKIESALKKPESQELLGDYMKEISDPKNREVFDYSHNVRNMMNTYVNWRQNQSYPKVFN